jgi:hypothetical protein
VNALKHVCNFRGIEFIFSLFRKKYSILPILIIIAAYPFIGTEINSKGSTSEWTVFLIYIFIIILFPGCIFISQNYLMRGLFVWGMGVLVLSIGIVKAALPSYEHGCLIQWLSSFKSSPWTMSLGKITEHRELLLWSPGLFFAVFVGIISILGYEASKKARDILLKRISSDNFVLEIGKLMDEIRKDSLKSRIYMIVSSPLIGQLNDDPNYKYVRRFWKWVLNERNKKAVIMKIICLTDLSAWELYEDFNKDVQNRNECKRKYNESKKCCDKLDELQKKNSAKVDIKIKRRDNLPLVRMLIIRTQCRSRGIFFMMVSSKEEGKTKLEIQGFQTEDPAVVDILSNIFEEEIRYEEPITRIGTERL